MSQTVVQQMWFHNGSTNLMTIYAFVLDLSNININTIDGTCEKLNEVNKVIKKYQLKGLNRNQNIVSDCSFLYCHASICMKN